MPRLAGQDLEYLLRLLRAYKAQTVGDLDGFMTAAAQPLTEAEIESLAHYMATPPASPSGRWARRPAHSAADRQAPREEVPNPALRHPAPSPFLENGLELRDGFQILRPAGGAFDPDEPFETEAAALDAKDLDRHAVGQEIFVRAAARDLAEEIEVADVRCQREVEPALDGRGIPAEGEPGRGAAQVGVMRRVAP